MPTNWYSHHVTSSTAARLQRVAAALHVLAESTSATRLERLLGFVCLLLEEAARAPRSFARFATGPLVVDLRRTRWTTELVVGSDDGRVFTALLGCALPFIAFESVTRFVNERSADFGDVFVLVGDDCVSISVLAEIDLEEEPDTTPSLSRDGWDAWDAWDADATVVLAPPKALLARLAR